MSAVYEFLGKVITEIINPLILLLAAGAFIVFLWGVFQFIVHAEDEGKREEGRSGIFWGIIGLVIIFGAYGIINIVISPFPDIKDPYSSGSPLRQLSK